MNDYEARVSMSKKNFKAALAQAKDAGYREAKAELLGSHTVVEEFKAQHPIMDDEDAVRADFAAVAAN